MKILSIHYGHNASIAYTDNGKIINILSEERFSRIKNHWGFPENSLEFIKKNYLDNDLSNIDKIVIIDKTGDNAKDLIENSFEPKSSVFPLPDKFRDTVISREKFYRNFKFFYIFIKKFLFKLSKLKNNKKCKRILQAKYQLPIDKISEYDHHLSHAATFCYFKEYDNNEKYLVFSMDGEGDFKSSTVNILEKDRFEEISQNSSEVSIGYFYSHLTYYLGLKAGEHEFKVMGLAPYGNKKRSDIIKKDLSKLIWINENGNFCSSTPSGSFIFELMEIFKLKRFDEIARSSQEFLEDLVTKWIDFWITKTNINMIAVGGGVFMNVKLNKVIHEMSNVKSFFAIPSCTDDSLPIGGIFLENIKNKINILKIDNLYYGRSFTKIDLKDFINTNDVQENFKIDYFESSEKLNNYVAELLSKNKVLGRFYGQEEFGARALGNRSIICNPSEFSNVAYINNLVKKRDFWMPFTPSILEERQDQYFLNPKKINASFMSSTFECTDLAKKHLKAAIHPSDNTIRPQVVTKNINFEYYDLIKKFENLTGVGAILNTSFNLSGYPNVSSPRDAVNTILSSGLEFLIFENYILKKIKINTTKN
ncbi:hypothetical protein N9X42_04785 [Candidatus Pelagibacter bacterium]|nr:hypothetical protein [Candidatus Pelagibacter bacterium]